jgi:hypothetical protein
MKRSLMKISCAVVLLAWSTFVAVAQDAPITTTKEVVVNRDGSYSVIEYPIGKEVMVNLLPGATLTGSKGMARIVRTADGTKIYVDVSGVPVTTTNYYAYAVDPAGTVNLLGPVTFKNGVATSEFTTPLNQFMVVLSPMEGLTAIDPTTVVFQSEIPEGYTVVPRQESGVKAVVISRTTTTTTTTPTAYEVPLLNVSTFGDREREVKLKFAGELDGLEAKAYINRQKGVNKIKLKFDDLDKAPVNTRFTLWASSADGKYTKLGQVINTGKRDNAAIMSETALTDFGLFLTVEDSDVLVPTGRIYSVFSVVPAPSK